MEFGDRPSWPEPRPRSEGGSTEPIDHLKKMALMLGVVGDPDDVLADVLTKRTSKHVRPIDAQLISMYQLYQPHKVGDARQLIAEKPGSSRRCLHMIIISTIRC
jgi:hypothetical protein